MTELERAETTKPQDKTFRIRLTQKQLRFLIHILQAYGQLRFDMEIRRQTELNFLREEFMKGGGYIVLQMFKQAIEESRDFDFCHPMTMGNKALDFAQLFERILEGGRPHRTWKYRDPLHGFKASLLRVGTRNMTPQDKHNIQVGK